MTKKSKQRTRRKQQKNTKISTDQSRQKQSQLTIAPKNPKESLVEVAIAISAAIIIFLIYSNSLDGPFVFDDENNIRDNTAIQISEITLDSLGSAALDSPHPSRFVAYISFALNHYIHGLHVTGYRVVNILIHIVNGILVYYFTKVTLAVAASPKINPRYREIAFLVAALWLVHPVAVQSVAYVVQRMNSLAALFFMLSMLLYIHGRLTVKKSSRILLFSASAISGLLAIGTKENAAALPLFIGLYEWFFFQKLDTQWIKKNYPIVLSLVGGFVVIALVFLGSEPLDRILNGYHHRNFTLGERLLTEPRVIFFYISLLLLPLPSRLNVNHDFSVSHGLTDPVTTLMSLVGFAIILFLAMYYAKRDRLVSFCIIWFFGNLIIESSFIPLELVFEHRTYVPSIGLFIILIYFLYTIKRYRWLNITLLAIVVAVWSLWAHERSAIWADRVAFWRDAVNKSPDIPRAHNNLGAAYEENGKFDRAFESYRNAVTLDPLFYVAWNNVGLIYLHRKNYSEALKTFQKSLRIKPDYVDTYKGLALTYRAMNNRQKYLEYLEKIRSMENNKR